MDVFNTEMSLANYADYLKALTNSTQESISSETEKELKIACVVTEGECEFEVTVQGVCF